MNRTEILTSAAKPTLKTIQENNIPETMKAASRWLLWNFVWTDTQWSKKPSGRWTDPITWLDFQTAFDRYETGAASGIGFVLGDGWAGVDLDDCINEDGELTLLAQEVVGTLDTYTETSPTGTGLKLVCKGIPPKGSKLAEGRIEMYGAGRYFTVTGDKLSGDVGERQHQLEAIHQKYATATPKNSTNAGPSTAALAQMLFIKPKESENDGSSRLFAWACRAVEHDLTDEQAVDTIRAAEKQLPFPKVFTDADICTRLRHAEEKAVRGSTRIAVVVGNDFPRAVTETIDALSKSEGVYQHLGRLTTICDQPPKLKYAKEDNGAPRLAFIPKDGMLEVLTKAADFYSYDGRSKSMKKCLPKSDLRNAVFCRSHFPGVRSIHGVVSRPILLPNGDIVAKSGYQADTGLFLKIDGEWPAKLSTGEAVNNLRDIWGDFPFDSPACEAACFAALLTLLCRNIIPGNTPLFMVDGNKPRCGKGLLSDTWTAIADGRRATRYSLSDQVELRKFLTALAIAGGDYVVFDNVSSRLGGATLEAAMTAGAISDRILGQSETITLPLSICWFATGNNCTLGRDMRGRTLPIRIDTPLSNPETRDGLQYPALIEHILEHRRELLMAGLSIVSNFIVAGAPKQDFKPFGGFEAWSDLIRSSIVFAGLPDPMDARAQLLEISDSDEPEIKQLMDAWKFPGPTNVKSAIEAVANDDAYITLKAILERRDKEVTSAEHLGKILRRAKGTVVDGRVFTHNGKTVPKWSVAKA